MASGRTAQQIVDSLVDKYGMDYQGCTFKVMGASQGKTTAALKASFFNLSIKWVSGPKKGRTEYWKDTPIELIESFFQIFNES